MSNVPFRGTEAVASGRLTRARLRGPRYRRVFPDVYLPADAPDDLETRSRAAYLLVSDRGGALGGYSAARLLGADCAPARAPAEVVIPGDLRARPGLRVVRGMLDENDIAVVDGCLVTTRLRTAWDLARRLSLVEAVVAVDALARRSSFDPLELLERRDRAPGTRGCRRLAEVVRLADPRADSPPETRLRLALVRAGLPLPEVQYPVVDEYGFDPATVDLAYPPARLAIEYDGATHYTRLQGEVDRRRDNELAAQGWETARLGRDDVGESMVATVARIARLLNIRAPDRYASIEIDRRAVRAA